MPFTDRFQLLDLKRDEGARTFEAREIATGRPVFVHLFADGSSPVARALLAKLDTLPDQERRRIIDRGGFQGGIYLVTDRLAEFGGLREWLDAHTRDHAEPLDARGAWAVKPLAEPPVSTLGNSAEHTLQMPVPHMPAPAPAATPKNGPGEFTREFVPPVLRPAPSALPLVSSPQEPGEFTRQFPASSPAKPTQAPTQTTQPISPPPGEFTKLFKAPQRPPPAPQTPMAPQPGEFTQMLQASPAPPATPAQPASPPQGEFTKLFQVPQRPAPEAAPRAPAAPQAGEFTQMLQAQRPATPAPPPSQASQTGEFTRFFQSPLAPQAQGAPLTPPRPPSPSRDAGEFTQVFGRGDIPSAPPPALSGPQSAPSANATQVFATPRQSPPAPLAAPMTPAPQPPIPRVDDEFAQMFAKPASLTFGQAPVGAPIAAPPPLVQKRNNSRLPLLLVVGAVVLLGIALILFFVLRSHAT